MNLTIMRGLVRRDLHDEDAQNYRWTDSELDRHIDTALRQFSRACPREEKAAIATTNGSRDISISGLTDMMTIVAVEYPINEFPRHFQQFSLYQTTITLLGSEVPDGGDCYVYYGKLHTLDSQSSTIPSQYEDLIAAGAAAYAGLEWAIYAVNRVNVGGEQASADFQRWSQGRHDYFQAELKKLRSQIKARSLYKPLEPPHRKTTDWGP